MNSSISTLLLLDLSGNRKWFKNSGFNQPDKEEVETLLEIIRKQTSSLEAFNFKDNGLSKDSTEKLLTTIADCGVLSTLEALDLSNTVSFDEFTIVSEVSVRKIADILAIAPVLKYCNIKGDHGRGKIRAEIEYKTEETMGTIKVF